MNKLEAQCSMRLVSNGLWPLSLALLLLSQPSTLHAQPAGPANQVLVLDGANSYVELPPNLFENPTQATVELWVKIGRPTEGSHFLDLGGYQRELYFSYEGTDPALKFLITEVSRERHRIERHRIVVPDLLQLNRWFHLAAVTGPGGVRLYCNGILVGTNAYAGGISGIGTNDNFIGRSSSSRRRPVYFQGEIDDVRVWGAERSESEIREAMFRLPTGQEPGLIGHWNFDDGSARDRGPAGRDGRLKGKAAITAATGPRPEDVSSMSLVVGRVRHAVGGSPVARALLFVTMKERVIQTGRADSEGAVQLVIRNADGPVRIWAVSDGQVASSGNLTLSGGARTELDLQAKVDSSENRSALVSALVDALRPERPLEMRRVVVDALGELEIASLTILSALTAALDGGIL